MFDSSDRIRRGSTLRVARHRFAAGDYVHEPSGLLELRVVRRGSSRADIDLGLGLRSVFTRPGDVMLSLPDRPTRFRMTDDREVTILSLSSAEAEARLRSAGGQRLADLIPLSDRPLRMPTVAALCHRLEEPDALAPSVADAMVIVVLAECLRYAQERRDGEARGPLSPSVVGALLAQLATQLADPITAESSARLLGVSRRTFSAGFKEITGLPFHQYVLRMRVEAAVTLLETTDLPVVAVATRCGFAHQAHLGRVMRRLKGKTPGAVRQDARATAANER